MFHAIISLRIALRAASSPLRNNSAVFLQHRNKCNFWYFVGFTVIFVVIFQSVSSFSVFSLIQIVIGFHSFFLFTAITSFPGNLLIIVALQKVTSIHPPSKLLFSCLALTDLCVGIILQPLNIAYMLSPHYYSLC